MEASGRDDLRELTANLDAKRLVRLAADMLWIWGHSEVRIVDGPGDGGRDVHAIAQDGGRVLVQCKFHADISKSCSSAEVSELPMALIKLGYQRGVFVTNAGISPQAKREYLDNYPGLQLGFLDGDIVTRTVLQHPLLRALWFDGSELRSIATALTLPLIVRDHETDAPILPLHWDPPLDIAPLTEALSASFPGLRFLITEARPPAHFFEPYRYPEPFAAEEGLMPFIRATEVVVHGELRLSMMPEVAESVAQVFTSALREGWPRVTVRIGSPHVTPLSGERGGVPVEVSNAAASFITTPACTCMPESVFFGIDGSGWSADTDARMSEADFIRLYEPNLDICSTYEVVGRPSGAHLMQMRVQNETISAGWDRSIFALLPPSESWPHTHIPEPDETIVWPWDGRVLCTWFDGSLVSEVVKPRTINESLDFFDALLEDRGDVLAAVESHLATMEDARVLSAREALHMVGSLGVKVFLDTERATTRTAEVSHYPEILPSPALPASRKLQVLAAWSVDEGNRGAIGAPLLPDDLTGPMSSVVELRLDSDYLVAEWCVPRLMLADPPTSSLLSQIAEESVEWLERVEAYLLAEGCSVRRATREFWRARHNVTLGVDPYDSDKAYAWAMSSDGQWTVVNAGRKFNRSTSATQLPAGMSEKMSQLFKSRWPPEVSED